jgi:hypothetical protein
MTQARTAGPIGILYEHPRWFAPLFAELQRRHLPYEAIPAHDHSFNPDARSAPYSLVVNRVSPSSYLRGHTNAIFHAAQYLAHLEEIGVPLVNGPKAYALETSKARQLDLLARLGIPHPRSQVVNSPTQIERAAGELEYPVIVKPNIGGSGALMRRFDTRGALQAALANGELDTVFGLDHTALVQEYHPPKDGSIVRVEALDGRFLYAIRIYNDPNQGFNLCPADICQVDARPATSDRPAEEFDFCPIDTQPRMQRKIEAADPPPWVVDSALRVFRAGGIDIGGVEYLESERDGQVYLYDVNALSNFVTDAPALVGFDPFVRFVDYLERRAGLARSATAA